MNVLEERIDTLVVARIATARRPPTVRAVALAVQRFAPRTIAGVSWQGEIARSVERLTLAAVLDEGRHPIHRDELASRIDVSGSTTWPQVADRVLPALALGIRASHDDDVLRKLTDRDAWTAAIAGRVLGLWSARLPPSLAALGDAFAWQKLGLSGPPKRCPAEIRALFLRRQLGDASGSPDRLLRLIAAHALAAARPDLRALRNALVAAWLTGVVLGHRADPPTSFPERVRRAAAAATTGAFGDRKVFISAVWQRLADPALSLDAFKAQLLDAHRTGALALARADLVAAMDPALVAESETRDDGASFHFVVREN